MSDLEAQEYPLPDAVLQHLQHLRDYVAADPGTATLAQTQHAVQDVIRLLHFLNDRFRSD